MEVLVVRLKPGDDLKDSLELLVSERGVRAGVLLCAVGSLRRAALRFAGSDHANGLEGPFEIVSGTGTLCPAGLHIHVSLADSEGRVRGGHLLSGCQIYTTAELAVADLSRNWAFDRIIDPATSYPELFAMPVRQEI